MLLEFKVIITSGNYKQHLSIEFWIAYADEEKNVQFKVALAKL